MKNVGVPPEIWVYPLGYTQKFGCTLKNLRVHPEIWVYPEKEEVVTPKKIWKNKRKLSPQEEQEEEEEEES